MLSVRFDRFSIMVLFAEAPNAERNESASRSQWSDVSQLELQPLMGAVADCSDGAGNRTDSGACVLPALNRYSLDAFTFHS